MMLRASDVVPPMVLPVVLTRETPLKALPRVWLCAVMAPTILPPTMLPELGGDALEGEGWPRIKMPLPLLPVIVFGEELSDPPTVLDDVLTRSMPSVPLPMSELPVAVVPIRLPMT